MEPEGSDGMIILETERLLFRDHEEADLGHLLGSRLGAAVARTDGCTAGRRRPLPDGGRDSG